MDQNEKYLELLKSFVGEQVSVNCNGEGFSVTVIGKMEKYPTNSKYFTVHTENGRAMFGSDYISDIDTMSPHKKLITINK